MNKHSRQLLIDKFSQIRLFADKEEAINAFPEKDIKNFLKSDWVANDDRIIAIMDEDIYNFWQHIIHDTKITTTYEIGKATIKVNSDGFWGGCFICGNYHIFDITPLDYSIFVRFLDF